jgi:hypothetical protein
MHELISSSQLQPTDIPAPDANYETISAFALTFDGYAWSAVVGAFANRTAAAYANDAGCLNERTLSELRACLFYEQRRHRHMGEDPGAEDRVYMGALM